MRSAPPKIMTRFLSHIIPPACREEVLGDLYECSDSPGQYLREAVRILPMVIFSRIRRTADSQVLFMQATALYMSFLGAAWCEGKTSLFQNSGLLRLAIPPAWVLVGQIIDDAYAVGGKRSLLKKMWGSVLGWGLAYLSQLAFSAGNGSLSLPARVMFFGSAAGLLLSIALKFMFPSATDRPVGVDKPAHWLKHTAEPFRAERELIIIARALLFVLVLAFIGGQVGGRLMAVALVLISVLLLILRELRRRWR